MSGDEFEMTPDDFDAAFAAGEPVEVTGPPTYNAATTIVLDFSAVGGDGK